MSDINQQQGLAMNKPFLKRAAVQTPAVYGHPEDDSFETTCAAHAEAYAMIYPEINWLRERLHASGRFSSDAHVEGELARNVQLLVEHEARKISKGQAADSPPAVVPLSQPYRVGQPRDAVSIKDPDSSDDFKAPEMSAAR